MGPADGPRTDRRWALLLALLLLLAACTPPSTSPPPAPSPSPTLDRPFTVLSTDVIGVADPAAVTDAASAMLSQNAFQRLMTADPGESVLKPDAARDCLFTAATTYTCTLNERLFFANGHDLTSSDVRFSIQRARRLARPGSSAPLLASLKRIETPSPLTVRFLLDRVDTQFGWALASPAASIVDEEVYPAGEVRSRTEPVVGSGPFRVAALTSDSATFLRNPDYVGRNPGRSDTVVYRTVADSAALEDAMAKGTADVVWRGLSAAAIVRYSRQAQASPRRLTDAGYALQGLTGTRVRMLQWSADVPERDQRAVRQAVAVALQGDRTLDSVVPGGVLGHVSAFPAGGRATPRITWSEPVTLTLGWDRTMPDGADQAALVAGRLTATGGFRIRLRPGTVGDLTLVDRKAWTPTGMAWLDPHLRVPLPPTAALLATLAERYRTRTQERDALATLAAMQRQAAVDATVLPLTQSDEYLLSRDGTTAAANAFGPGWQLGLWGMDRG